MKRQHKVKWTGALSFTGTTPEGHSAVLDGDKAIGMSPMDMLLLGTAACASIDLVMILQKSRQKVIDAWVEVGGERREEMPRYFTHIEMHFVVKGIGVKATAVERGIELAMAKYCSASAQMAALANIQTSYEIIESELP